MISKFIAFEIYKVIEILLNLQKKTLGWNQGVLTARKYLKNVLYWIFGGKHEYFYKN